ncbi:MAG: HAD hydrolase family protein [Planctomycetota bacterium]
MTRYKLLAVDVDGTLVGPDQRVSARTRRAIASARRAGLVVCLATGRGVKEVVPVRREAGLDGAPDPLVCISGALVCDGRTTRALLTQPMTMATAVAGCEAIAGTGLSAVALVDPGRWGYDYIHVPGADADHIERVWFSRGPFGVRRVDSLADLDPAPEILRLTAITDGDRAERVRGALGAACGESLRVERIDAPNYGIHVVECFAAGADKWTGLRHVAARHRIDAADIAAIGDDVNDLPLFAHVGLAVAMGNAAEPVRRAAGHVTAGHDADGLAIVIERLLDTAFDA